MRLGLTRTIKLTLASLFIQTSWSFTSLQELGFIFNLIAGTDRDQKKKVLEEYRGIFNTHPYMASYIVGATLRAYDDATMTPDEIKRFIEISQSSFASAGDLLFWQTIRPALLLLAIILGLTIGPLGPIIAFVIYNVLHLFHRIQGLNEGYDKGSQIIYVLKSKRFTLVQRMFEIAGALLTGGLIAVLHFKLPSLLFVPIMLLFAGLLLKRTASVIIVIIAFLLTLIIVLV